MIYNKTIYFILILNIFCLKFFYSQEYTNLVIKTYPIDSLNSLEIINKYGDIIINNGDKDSIKIKAFLIINANNEQKLNKIKKDINFLFELKKENHLSIKTNIGSSAKLIENLFSTQNQIKQNYNIKITYYVFIPSLNNLESINLETKYGDIFIENTKAKLNIKISHGSLIVKNIENESNLNIFSTNVCIDRINQLQINALYSDVEINKAKKLDIESRATRYNISNSNEIIIKSHNDDISINYLNSLNGDFKFSEITINKLNHDINCTLNYGKLRINQINKTVSLIYINSYFSDIDLLFPRDFVGAFIDVKYTKVSSINFTPDFCKVEERLLNTENELYLLFGKCGNSPETKININLTNKNSLSFIKK